MIKTGFFKNSLVFLALLGLSFLAHAGKYECYVAEKRIVKTVTITGPSSESEAEKAVKAQLPKAEQVTCKRK